MKNIKNNLPFNPEGNIFRWGPVPGKFFYCSVFTAVHYNFFRAKYNENWSETLWLFLHDRMFWVNDWDDIRTAGLRVFLKYLLPVNTRAKIYDEWQGYTQELSKLMKQIDQTNLTELSNEELKKLWHNFHEVYINFWVAGSIPELANYGTDKYLADKLKTFISDEKELTSALEILTAPAKLSFYQEEEIDLQKTEDLSAHQQQYFWLKNSYAGTEVLSTDFFARRKPEIKINIEKEMKERLTILSEQKLYSILRYLGRNSGH
jgi:hypothetical protein